MFRACANRLFSVVAQLRPCAIAHWRTFASVSFPFSWLQCGGPCAVALVCVFSSFISLDPDTTRVHGSREKLDRTDSRACVAHLLLLGSGAMGSRLREQWTNWTDPLVFSQPDQWKGFLLAKVNAHEADRFVVHAKLLRRDQHQVQPMRSDVEGSQTRHF